MSRPEPEDGREWVDCGRCDGIPGDLGCSLCQGVGGWLEEPEDDDIDNDDVWVSCDECEGVSCYDCRECHGWGGWWMGPDGITRAGEP